MWAIAAERFSVPPFSNGHDKRYEQVKAELRGMFGKSAINKSNKARLKDLARNKGIEDGSAFAHDDGQGKAAAAKKPAEHRLAVEFGKETRIEADVTAFKACGGGIKVAGVQTDTLQLSQVTWGGMHC